MAIDMIEHSDLPAAAQDRRYIQQYSTDDSALYEKTDGDYSNFALSNLSLVGRIIGEVKSNKSLSQASSRNEILLSVNKAFPIPKNNCEDLFLAKTKLDTEVYKVNQEILAGDSAKNKKDYMNALNGRLATIKSMLEELNCVKLQEEADLKKNQADTLAALEKAKADGVPDSEKQKINNYIIWGISGFMVIAAVIILLKKKKTPQ